MVEKEFHAWLLVMGFVPHPMTKTVWLKVVKDTFDDTTEYIKVWFADGRIKIRLRTPNEKKYRYGACTSSFEEAKDRIIHFLGN